VTGMMFNYEKKWGNHQQQFVFVTRSCACLWSFEIHNNMSVESTIEKLQWIEKEKEA
jgi:hypothetical protein